MVDLDNIQEIHDDEIRVIGTPKSDKEEIAETVNNEDCAVCAEISLEKGECFYRSIDSVLEETEEESLIIENDNTKGSSLIKCEDSSSKHSFKFKWYYVIPIIIFAFFWWIGILMLGLFCIDLGEPVDETRYALYDPIPYKINTNVEKLGENIDPYEPGYVQIKDTVINDIALRIYIPHNAIPSLELGYINKNNDSIIFAAQAADVREDNGDIVGAFVLKGEPKAWGLSKKGYCAIIDNQLVVGVADNSPLFEMATETGGYFFRQYPLVDKGRMIENEPRGKAVRRSLCYRAGETIIVETKERQSFYDFAQALQDFGVRDAIYLVGSSAYGWAVDKEGNKTYFGNEKLNRSRRKIPKNISYIVWKKK